MTTTTQRPADRSTSKRATTLGGLLLLNVLLLAVLAAVTFSPAAEAQAGRIPGNYTIVGGGVNGHDGAAMYIVDTVNQEVIALVYDRTSSSLQGIGYRNLAADARSVSAGRSQPR